VWLHCEFHALVGDCEVALELAQRAVETNEAFQASQPYPDMKALGLVCDCTFALCRDRDRNSPETMRKWDRFLRTLCLTPEQLAKIEFNFPMPTGGAVSC
jgi:hypothetical protein